MESQLPFPQEGSTNQRQHAAVAEAEGFPCLTSWCRFPSSTCCLLMMLSPTNTMLSYCCHQWDCQSKGPIGLSTNHTIHAPIIAEQPGLLAFLKCIISADDEQPKVGAKRRAHPLIASEICLRNRRLGESNLAKGWIGCLTDRIQSNPLGVELITSGRVEPFADPGRLVDEPSPT